MFAALRAVVAPSASECPLHTLREPRILLARALASLPATLLDAMKAAELTDCGVSEVVPAVHLRGAGARDGRGPRGYNTKSNDSTDFLHRVKRQRRYWQLLREFLWAQARLDEQTVPSRVHCARFLRKSNTSQQSSGPQR